MEELRAAAPADAPTSLLELASQCCASEPDERPAAADVVTWLEELRREVGWWRSQCDHGVRAYRFETWWRSCGVVQVARQEQR